MTKGESLSKIFGVALVFVLLASTPGVLVWASGSNAMVAGSVDVSAEQPTATIDSDTNAMALDVSAEGEYEAGPIADAESSSSLSSEIDAGLDAGKPVFLFFHADWCHFCQEEMPIIEELELEYTEQIVVIYVNSEDNPQAMAEFGVTGFPTMFLISDKSTDGEYRYQEFGGFTDKETLGRSFDWVIAYGSIPRGSGADSDMRGEETIAAIAANFSQDLCIRALQADACPDHCECLTDEEAEERELTPCDDELTECEIYYAPMGVYVTGHCYRTDSFLTLNPAHPLPGERTTIELRDMDESKSDVAILYLDDRVVDICAADEAGNCQLEFIFSDDVEIYIAVIADYGQEVSFLDTSGVSLDPDVVALFWDDDDEDGVPNAFDNCRYDKNADQLDFDQDLVGDACDDCDPARYFGITVRESWDSWDSEGCGWDDTDDGHKYYTQGEIRRQNKDKDIACQGSDPPQICGDMVTTLATDYCVDGATLREYYLVGAAGRGFNYQGAMYTCPYGGCQTGVCLCHDTDGGKDYDVQGSVGDKQDSCYSSDGQNLIEWSVEMRGEQCFRLWEGHKCEGSCQDGACVPATCEDGVQNQGETNIDCGGPNCQSCDIVWVTGRIWYQEADAIHNGLTLGGFRPTRSVHVGLYDRSKTKEIAHTVTNRQGYFYFVVTRDPGAQYYVKVQAKNYAAVVIKDVDGACNEYIIWSSVSEEDEYIPQPPDNVDFGDLYIYPDGEPGGDFVGRWYEKHCSRNKGDRVGGSQWFNIAEAILMARDYVGVHRVNPDNDNIARVWVQYPDDSGSWCNPFENEITLSSPGAGGGYDRGFLDSNIMHEYGHHIQFELSGWRVPNYGGFSHTICRKVADHETAFLEGWAHYLSHIVYYHALDYQDPAYGTIVSAADYWDIGVTWPNAGNLQDGCKYGNTGHKEGSVLTVLWNLADGTPSLPDYTNESWDRLSGLEDFIISCLDRQMDDWTAPEVCELRQCATAAGVSLNDLNEILSAMGISDC